MMLYLDTSSLVKLYVEEPGTNEVRQDLGEAETVATSAVSYAEARAAFARHRREGKLTPSAFLAVKRDFDADWLKLVVIAPTVALCRTAGDLAERHRLRGCDSIQLATFLELARERRPSDMRFSSFDRALSLAATSAIRRYRRSRV
jgi:predicted nucleic acid-binding protein